MDPERFLEDDLEPMAKIGMGVIYQRTSYLKPLRNPPTPAERQALIQRFYEPHHQQLDEAVAKELSRDGRAIVIDCHSFPSRPLPYERLGDNAKGVRPHIFIGTDPFHTPNRLVEIAQQAVADEGLTCAVNRPFSGTMVPGRFYRRDKRVISIMVEVNRALYMDEVSGERSGDYKRCQESLRKIIHKIRSRSVGLCDRG